MRRTAILLIILLTCYSGSWCQIAVKVSYETTTKNLGDVKESQGPVTHRFDFTNNGKDPIQVDSVTASCGCTATSWSLSSIGSGAVGFVEVQFDPNNRPGPFEKSLVVHYKNSLLTTSLQIKGFVIPRPASIEEAFPLAIGHLRLKNRYLNLGNIPKKRMFTKSFEVYNSSSSILVFSDDMEGPDHVTVTFEPYTLKPKSIGKMWVHYDVAAKNDLGYFREDIAVFTYESSNQRKELILSATLMDIPQKTGGNQAKIHIPESTRDFGIKQQGDTVNVAFTLTNQGKTVLEVKKVFSSCNCMRVQISDQKIQPGGSATVKATFLTNQRLGNQQKAITIFTNDPDQPVSVLTLKGLLRGPVD